MHWMRLPIQIRHKSASVTYEKYYTQYIILNYNEVLTVIVFSLNANYICGKTVLTKYKTINPKKKFLILTSGLTKCNAVYCQEHITYIIKLFISHKYKILNKVNISAVFLFWSSINHNNLFDNNFQRLNTPKLNFALIPTNCQTWKSPIHCIS